MLSAASIAILLQPETDRLLGISSIHLRTTTLKTAPNNSYFAKREGYSLLGYLGQVFLWELKEKDEKVVLLMWDLGL